MKENTPLSQGFPDEKQQQIEDLQEECSNLAHFAEIGVYVRTRLLESINPIQPRDLEMRHGGNSCAHSGMAIADAMLYTSGVGRIVSGLHRRTDFSVYMDMYGLDPIELLKWRDVPQVLQMVSWRCTVRLSLTADEFDSTYFQRYYDEAWKRIRTFKDHTPHAIDMLFRTERMSFLFDTMSKGFEEAFQRMSSERTRRQPRHGQ